MTETFKVPESHANIRVSCQPVTLYETHVEMTLPNGLTRSVSIGDFTASLAKTMAEEARLEPQLLPANCYLTAQTLNEMRLACYYPSRKRKIKFVRNKSTAAVIDYEIVFPNVVITHYLMRTSDAWEHRDARYFGTSKSIGQLTSDFIAAKNEPEQIWSLPLPNVHGDARLCYGHNTVSKGPYKGNFRGLDWFFAMLYSTPFNEDLPVCGLASPTTPEEWVKILSKPEEFPYELLKYGIKVDRKTRSVAEDIIRGTERAATGSQAVGTLTDTPRPAGRTIHQAIQEANAIPFTEQEAAQLMRANIPPPQMGEMLTVAHPYIPPPQTGQIWTVAPPPQTAQAITTDMNNMIAELETEIDEVIGNP